LLASSNTFVAASHAVGGSGAQLATQPSWRKEEEEVGKGITFA
jgi:hypothetical protein